MGKHLDFEPRVREAIEIASLVKVNSMMDISDGVSSDLNRICHQSKVGAVVYQERIPVSEAARQSDDPVAAALNDGEDFELLFTLAEKEREKLSAQWRHPLPITCIGKIVEGERLTMQAADGRTMVLEPQGYDHLRGAGI
jgi:thiamine-monophosphate kinase